MRDDIEQIRAALGRSADPSSDFDLNPGITLPHGRSLRAAGVLIALMDDPMGPRVILTKRASHLKHHPGQIAFPGGKVEGTDKDPIDAALREAHEEIGLPQKNVGVIGTLPLHETVTGFCITPVLAHVTSPFTPRPQPGEVDEVFSVPLSHVTDPRCFQVQSRLWQGRNRYYYTVPFGPYYIWGATARILFGLAQRMTHGPD